MYEYFDTHKHGECIHNPTHKVICINIPRCASSTMKHIITIDGGIMETDYFSIPDPDTYFTFAVIRDPVTRFVSAIAHISDDRHNVDDLTRYLDRIEMLNDWADCHLLPQTAYLHNIHIDQYLDFDTLNTTGLRILQEHLPLEAMPCRHASSPQTLERLYHALTPSIVRRINKLYKADRKLYKKHRDRS